MKSEPVLILAALRAGLLCAVTFGFHLTPEQTGAVMLFAEAIIAVYTRSQVTPA